MRVSDFRWSADRDGEWLSIRTTRARAICETLDPCKQYDFTVEEHRERRSKDANAYFWVLAGKLSAKLHITPEEVYRQYIPDIGDNYKIVPVRKEDIDHWNRIWCSGHIGRIAEDIGPCRTIPGYRNVRSYYSSSDYDTRQMSRLIDLIVQDCKENGIETLTPDKLEAMKTEWEKAYGNK